MLACSLSLEQLAQVGTIVAAVTSILVATSVILLWKQVRQAASDSRVELITGLTTLIVSIDQLFVEHPGMWKYFSSDAAPPKQNTTEREQAHAIALAMANTLDHIVEHLDLMKSSTRRSWCAYIREVYEKSSVFRDALDEHRTWWPGLQAQVRNSGA